MDQMLSNGYLIENWAQKVTHTLILQGYDFCKKRKKTRDIRDLRIKISIFFLKVWALLFDFLISH